MSASQTETPLNRKLKLFYFRSSRTFSESSSSITDNNKRGGELDATLPDFCQPQRMSVCEQTNVSYIDVSPNLIQDIFDSLLTHFWPTFGSLLTHSITQLWSTFDSLLTHFCYSLLTNFWLTFDALLTHSWHTLDSRLCFDSLFFMILG